MGVERKVESENLRDCSFSSAVNRLGHLRELIDSRMGEEIFSSAFSCVRGRYKSG